jgi:hypothetical protein
MMRVAVAEQQHCGWSVLAQQAEPQAGGLERVALGARRVDELVRFVRHCGARQRRADGERGEPGGEARADATDRQVDERALDDPPRRDREQSGERERRTDGRGRWSAIDIAQQRQKRPVPQVQRIADEADEHRRTAREQANVERRVARSDDEAGAQHRQHQRQAG